MLPWIPSIYQTPHCQPYFQPMNDRPQESIGFQPQQLLYPFVKVEQDLPQNQIENPFSTLPYAPLWFFSPYFPNAGLFASP